jgi:Uma2 family endonuclease
MTLAEWGELDEDVAGELVDGRLVEDEEVGYLHEVVVAWLIRILGDWLTDRGGFVGASDARFAVSPTRGRKPDLSVYLAGRLPSAAGARPRRVATGHHDRGRVAAPERCEP